VAQLDTVGDVIGHAVRLFRLNYAPIVQALFVPTMICVAGRTLFQWGISQHFSFQNLVPQAATCLLGLGIALWAVWRLSLLQLALMVQYVADGPNYKIAFKTIEQRQMQLFNCFLIAWIAAFVNVIVWSILAVGLSVVYSSTSNSTLGNLVAGVAICGIAIFGLICVTVLIIALWALALVVSSLENETFARVYEDCGGFIVKDFWRIVYFFCAIFCALMALLMPLYFPPLIVGLFEVSRYAIAHPGKHLTQLPFYLLVLGQAWESIVNMIIWPIFYFSVGFFYRDLKMRQHASDVLQKLDNLKLSGASGV